MCESIIGSRFFHKPKLMYKLVNTKANWKRYIYLSTFDHKTGWSLRIEPRVNLIELVEGHGSTRTWWSKQGYHVFSSLRSAQRRDQNAAIMRVWVYGRALRFRGGYVVEAWTPARNGRGK